MGNLVLESSVLMGAVVLVGYLFLIITRLELRQCTRMGGGVAAEDFDQLKQLVVSLNHIVRAQHEHLEELERELSKPTKTAAKRGAKAPAKPAAKRGRTKRG